MPAFFANPLGFLGLLAIPAILAIHMLREKSRRVPTSTLFLLENLTPRTPTGRTFHRLQDSLPMWLQILVAVLFTWLLVDPRWVRADSSQQVTLILDTTASMSAARPRALQVVPAFMEQTAKNAARTHWTVLTTHAPESPLYRGSELGGVAKALAEWTPTRGNHDPSRAFSLALVDTRDALVFFATDRIPETVPAGVQVIACGKPLDNVGFVGATTTRSDLGPQWKALVKNSGSTTQQRTWWFETEEVRSQIQPLEMEPGRIVTLEGPFPPGATQVKVMLSADEFQLDDALPLVLAEPKPFRIFIDAPEGLTALIQRIVATVPGARRVSSSAEADLMFVAGGSTLAEPLSKPSARFGVGGNAAATPGAPIVGENHPFVEGLRWDGLLHSAAGSFNMSSTDEALLWQREQPLAFLHSSGGARHLMLNFDVEKSNADRLPSFVLLVSRFLSAVQAEKRARFSENFETHQRLPLSEGSVIAADQPNRERAEGELRAPDLPGFFSVRDGKEVLLQAAAYFADSHEADLREARESIPDIRQARLVRMEHTTGDPFALGWIGLAAAALVGSWAALGRASRE